MCFEKDLVNKAIALIDEKSKSDELKAFTDVNDINNMIRNLQINRDYQCDAIKLNQRLREEYPNIEKLLNLGRRMVNNSVNNNTRYDVCSAIIADLNADKYGIYVDVKNSIKVLNDWRVAIDPACLNKLAKMLLMPTKINRNYREYNNLMEFLTTTGMNLYEFINIREERFLEIYDKIFGKTNTHEFGDVLIRIRKEYSRSSCKLGQKTIGYMLLLRKKEK